MTYLLIFLKNTTRVGIGDSSTHRLSKAHREKSGTTLFVQYILLRICGGWFFLLMRVLVGGYHCVKSRLRPSGETLILCVWIVSTKSPVRKN